jgi:hypothetical protein
MGHERDICAINRGVGVTAVQPSILTPLPCQTLQVPLVMPLGCSSIEHGPPLLPYLMYYSHTRWAQRFIRFHTVLKHCDAMQAVLISTLISHLILTSEAVHSNLRREQPILTGISGILLRFSGGNFMRVPHNVPEPHPARHHRLPYYSV